MSDPWFSEIELQKVFSMSPGEAYCRVCMDGGLTVAEIAETAGISQHTVHTLLKRGNRKMKKVTRKDGDTVMIVISKGNPEVNGALIKLNTAFVLAELASLVNGAVVNAGEHFVVVRGFPAGAVGDAGWMKETVFRKVDIYGATTRDEAKRIADRMKAVYDEKDGGEGHFGLAVIRNFLDNMYMKYEVIPEDI